MIESYADAVAVMRSAALQIPQLPLADNVGTAEERVALAPLWEQARYIPLYTSGRAHRRLRHELRDPFTRQAVDDWRPFIRETADALVATRRTAGRAEVIEDIGKPLLHKVMCEVVGIPHASRDAFGRWARATVQAGALGTPQWSPETLAEVTEGVESIDQLVGELLKDPHEIPPGSMLAHAAERRSTGAGLSEREVAVNARALYTAGAYTTIYLIAAAAYFLFRDDDLLAEARSDSKAIRKIVAETLRFACPAVETALRRATQDVVIGGQTIRRGQFVRTVVLHASRDPQRFPEPNAFDHRRPRQGSALAFGVGSHVCLGNHLATAIAEETCAALAAPRHGARLAEPHPEFRRRPAVPVMWGPEWVHLSVGTTRRTIGSTDRAAR
ncbi:cytochrome P450 [Streptomyces sp. NPDC056656]|uniref:cytochrome P450 n=1 Tax=Streptomyces sp. NPDC056656 TaxID=3345895 RepID=UPI0036854FFD